MDAPDPALAPPGHCIKNAISAVSTSEETSDAKDNYMKNKMAAGAAAALLLAMAFAAGRAPMAALAEPNLTEQNPAYGDVLQTLPESLHLCFSEPVKVDESSDWKFSVLTPEGRALGLRIVFKPSGDCVDVFPGAPEEPPQGIWTFEWLVHGQADGSEASGVVKFQLGELQPGETPLEKPDSGDATETGGGNDGGSTAGLYVAIGAGAALILVAGGGFALSKRRRT